MIIVPELTNVDDSTLTRSWRIRPFLNSPVDTAVPDRNLALAPHLNRRARRAQAAQQRRAARKAAKARARAGGQPGGAGGS